MTPQTPARLFVFLAREAHVGVILRRGPSDWVQMIQWHTKTDVFKPGQWFHGRIFERRCDLSADGKYFVYRAFKPGNRLKNPDYGDSWSAVSTPPHFTAKALWVNKSGDGGGGYFFEDGRMFLNHLDDNRNLHPAYRLPKGLEVKTVENYEDENNYMFNNIYSNIMLRDGWKPDTAFRSGYLPSFYAGATPPKNDIAAILTKTKDKVTLICHVLNQHQFTLHPKRNKAVIAKMRKWAKTFSNDNVFGNIMGDMVKNPYRTTISHRYEYALSINEKLLELDGVTWADFDRNKRLVLAKEGKLFSAEIVAGELMLIELADFNDNRPHG